MNATGGIILMWIVLIVVLAVNSRKIQPRVLSCKLSLDRHYPFEAVVIINNKFACTATMITRRHFLTVAHCVAHVVKTKRCLRKVKIRVGSITKYHGASYRTQRISHHPGFAQLDPDFYIHDIAVLHIMTMVLLSDEVAPVMLPQPNSNVPSKVLVLFSAYAGIGTKNKSVSTLLMRIIANTEVMEECRHFFASYDLIKEQVCIEISPEFRYGPVDSGGPMLDIAETTIFGLASSVCNRNGTKEIPKIFTKVSEYIPYILEELNYDTPNYSSANPPPAAKIVWSKA